MRIEASSCSLAARSIRWINKHCCITAPGLEQRFDEVHAVRFVECDSVGVFRNGVQPSDQRLGVPTGQDTLAVLSTPAEGRPRSKNSGPMGAVQYERPEPLVYYPFVGSALQITNSLARRREFGDTSDKTRSVKECRSPECGNITVKFHEYRPFGQVLHDCGQGDDGTAGERLDEQPRARPGQPRANVWHQPRLPTGIAQRASLRHLCDIDRRNATDRIWDVSIMGRRRATEIQVAIFVRRAARRSRNRVGHRLRAYRRPTPFATSRIDPPAKTRTTDSHPGQWRMEPSGLRGAAGPRGGNGERGAAGAAGSGAGPGGWNGKRAAAGSSISMPMPGRSGSCR